MPPIRFFPICIVIGVLAALTSPVQAAEPAKAVRVSITTIDKSRLVGRITAHDQQQFELTTTSGESRMIPWKNLDAANQFIVRSQLIDKAKASEWLELGRVMRRVKGGESHAEKAFARALRIDASLADAVKTARTEVVKPQFEEGENSASDSEEMSDHHDVGEASGPKVVGAATTKVWPELSEDEQAQSIRALEGFAAVTQEKLKKELTRYETRYFLFYSDLSSKESRKWAGLLDRMYARLAELFGVEKGKNVWRGKALVFVFSDPSDYRTFQRVMHNTDPGSSAGMCHAYGEGEVHIAFFRQPDEMKFAHVLVHESVHGFLHRFIGPIPIPSWANEGLAEVIASELVPRADRANRVTAAARRGLSANKGMSRMFEMEQIDGWQYPVAETLCEFMIRSHKRGYVDFITGIKEGLTWQDSLDQRYKVSRLSLVKHYGQSIGIKDLKE